jgi:hypothetical protein
MATASTSGLWSARACSNHGPNHSAVSAPAAHGCGASRTQVVVLIDAVVNFGSAKVLAEPVIATVRAPSVNVAMTAPEPSLITVLGGPSSRSKRSAAPAAAPSSRMAIALAGAWREPVSLLVCLAKCSTPQPDRATTASSASPRRMSDARLGVPGISDLLVRRDQIDGTSPMSTPLASTP